MLPSLPSISKFMRAWGSDLEGFLFRRGEWTQAMGPKSGYPEELSQNADSTAPRRTEPKPWQQALESAC